MLADSRQMSLFLLQRDYLCGLGMEHQEKQTFAKETSKKELQFFRIINLQKIKVNAWKLLIWHWYPTN